LTRKSSISRTIRPALAALCLALLPASPVLLAEEDAAAPAAERAPLEERSREAASGLERQLPAREHQRLKAGEESFLVLWQPANVDEPSGLVILLPGEGESADWPEAVGPLRRELPDAGWSTLALTLPDPSGDPLPPRPLKTEEPTRAEPAVSPEKAEEDGPANTEQAGHETDTGAYGQVACQSDDQYHGFIHHAVLKCCSYGRI